MLFILGMAFVIVGLWEELAGYMGAIREDEEAVYYAIITFLKFIGSFMRGRNGTYFKRRIG